MMLPSYSSATSQLEAINIVNYKTSVYTTLFGADPTPIELGRFSMTAQRYNPLLMRGFSMVKFMKNLIINLDERISHNDNEIYRFDTVLRSLCFHGRE